MDAGKQPANRQGLGDTRKPEPGGRRAEPHSRRLDEPFWLVEPVASGRQVVLLASERDPTDAEHLDSVPKFSFCFVLFQRFSPPPGAPAEKPDRRHGHDHDGEHV